LALPRLARRADDRGMEAPTHQCPYCELRFDYHNEILDHVTHDHPDHAAVTASVELHELPHA
jgi:hypothetical protein